MRDTAQALARRILQAAKRRTLVRLGMVSDQKFYLDSAIVQPRKDVERIMLHSDAVEIEFVLPVDGSRARNSYRPRFVYGLSDATIDPIPSLVYDSKGQYIAESSSWLQLRQFWDWPKPKIRVPRAGLTGEFIFLPSNNYYHWLIEDLPVFLRSLAAAPKARVIVPRSAAGYVREVAGLIDNEKVFIGSPTRVERLVMTAKTGGMGSPVAGLTPHPADVAILREFFGKYFESGSCYRKLCLSRVGQARSPRNERDLQSRLEKLGFTTFDGMGMSVCSQIALFSRARWLIGLHGAAFSNIVWASEGVEVCEIFSSGYLPSCYSALTAMRAGRYTSVSYTANANNNIDAETLERIAEVAGDDFLRQGRIVSMGEN
jgi:capsular polysaccharide biosynthesis protein